jgi:ADP-ribose pyrophosphatase YjhB (NUDIX family)
METYKCPKGCCTIKIKPYTTAKDPLEKFRRRRRKAGVFIYDPETDKVLLVQSRGHLWGPPKGTLNYAETERLCAVREVKEETGIKISDDDFTRAIKIRNRAIYFYMEKPECYVEVQNHIRDNDANGVGWIKPDCLVKCIENGNISLSQHCRLVFKRFMDRGFPHSTFSMVGHKKCSSRF